MNLPLALTIWSHRFCPHKCDVGYLLEQIKLSGQGTVIGITKPSPTEGAWSALLHIFLRQNWTDYLIKRSTRPLLEEVAWYRLLCNFFIDFRGRVCYQDVGCFSTDWPFDYCSVLPSDPKSIGTKFQLYTRKNWNHPENLDIYDLSRLQKSHFIPWAPLKIIIHGYWSSCSHYEEMIVNLLQHVRIGLY